MTLIIQKPTGAKLNLKQQPVVQAEADINAYISLVELTDAANGQSGGLETGVKDALKAFAVGCASDGIWNAIKASCILAGAKTLQGALVPLVGLAPTNFNFAAGTYSGSNYTTGDYNRKTGLASNGTTKYLSSNRASNADPPDSRHGYCYATTKITNDNGYFGIQTGNSADYHLQPFSGSVYTRNLSTSPKNWGSIATFGNGGYGMNRQSSTSYNVILGSTFTGSETNNSNPPNGSLISILAHANFPGNGRIAFYSIGESLNLTQLDTRVSALITAIGAAF